MLSFETVLMQRRFNMSVLLKQLAVSGKAAHSEIMKESIHLLRRGKSIHGFLYQQVPDVRTVAAEIQIADYAIRYAGRDIPLLIKSKSRCAILNKPDQPVSLVGCLDGKLFE